MESLTLRHSSPFPSTLTSHSIMDFETLKNTINWGAVSQDQDKPEVINIRLSDLVNTCEISVSNTQSISGGVFSQSNPTPSEFGTEKLRQSEMEIERYSESPSSWFQAGPSTPIAAAAHNESAEDLHFSDSTVHIKLSGMGNPQAPFTVIESFPDLKGITPDLLKGIYAMNFSKPSKIQSQAIPLILEEPFRNLIGQSQSGTGKTAAFVLACLLRIDSSIPHTQAICIAPSRELSRQIENVFHTMCKYTNFTSTVLIKDVFKRKPGEAKYIPRNALLMEHVIIGTPGIIMDCLRRKKTIDTRHIKLFILDEADNMLDQDGLGDQSIRIKNLIGGNPQILLFSATFPDHVYRFAHRFAPNPNEITLRLEELSVVGIKQFYMDCHDEDHKYSVLCNIYDLLTVSQSIIFCKRRDTADEITARMKELGHSVGCIHGRMSSTERDSIIDDFRCGQFKVLISTNLVSRGIDISQVTLVVNYDMPLDMKGFPDAEVYLHRIGRTGRFGRIGTSVVFVHDQKTYEDMKYLEHYFHVNIRRVPTEDWQEAEAVFKEFF